MRMRVGKFYEAYVERRRRKLEGSRQQGGTIGA
jgi:hypothetical protein